MKMNRTPPHPGAGGGNDEDEIMADDMEDTFDEDDLIEIHDDDENDETDLGDFADDEEDDMDGEPGPGMEGFTGQKPDFILTTHQESAVFCCSFDSTGNRLISGGEDDVANIWDDSSIKSQSPICICRGHKDSVVSASFSWDSTFCSTADLSGVVKVWKVANNELVATFETGELSWSFWHFGSNVLFAGCDDGSVYMWKIPTGDCKLYTGSSEKCESAVLMPDGKRLLAGYACGTLKLFDLKSGDTLFNFTKSIPNSSAILCVAAHPSKHIVACGSTDGTVKLFNSQNGKFLHTISCMAASADNESSSSVQETVESIAFSPTELSLDYLACGTVNGNIVVWDIASMTQRFRVHQDDTAGLTKLLWDPKLPLIYTAGIDGVIRVLDVRTCKVERLLGRHRTEILDICITKDGSRMASASEDGSVFIYNLQTVPST